MSFSKYTEQEQRESSFLWVPFSASVRSLLKGWEARGPLLSMYEGVWSPDVDTADRVSSLSILLTRGSSLPMQVPYTDRRATGSQPQSCPAYRGNWDPTIPRTGDTLISIAAI